MQIIKEELQFEESLKQRLEFNNSQKEIAERYIDKRIDKQKILFEPKTCNTATCICYAMTSKSIDIYSRYMRGRLLFLPGEI